MATLRNPRPILAYSLGQWPSVLAQALMGGTGPVLLPAKRLDGRSRSVARLGETRLQCSVYPNSDQHDMKKLMIHWFVNQVIGKAKQSKTSKTHHDFINPLPSGPRAQGQDGPQEPAPAPGAKVSDKRPEPGQAT
jgi:hypothetical protein